MKASDVGSIALTKVVIRSSSMHLRVVSGLIGSMRSGLSFCTSELTTQPQRMGSAALDAATTFACDEPMHSITLGIASGSRGPTDGALREHGRLSTHSGCATGPTPCRRRGRGRRA